MTTSKIRYNQLNGTLTKEPTGFFDTTTMTIAYTDGPPPTFTITPTGTTWVYWIQSVRKVQTAKSITWGSGGIPSIAEGIWYVYLDTNQNLLATQTWTDALITDYALVSAAYWDNTNSIWLYKAEERHGLTMDSNTHLEIHDVFGSLYQSGLGLDNFSIQVGSPTNNAAAQFSYASGEFHDEDLSFVISTSANPCVLPVFYRSGANGSNIWRKQTANNIPTVYNSGTGILRWNQLTGGNWQQTDVTNNDYVLCHIFATNDTAQPVVAIEGQAVYTTATNARTGATTELNNLLLGGMPFVEFIPIGTVIYQTNTAWTNNAKHCKVVEYSTGVSWVDFRKTSRTGVGGITISDHNSLAGLQGGTVGEYYHLTSAQYSSLGGGSSIKSTITQSSHGFVAKDVIRYNGSAWVKAQADTAANAEALGIVESVSGNDFVVVYCGLTTIAGAGWTAGLLYRLDDVTAGGLVSTDAPASTIMKPMLFTTSTTTGIVLQMSGFQVSDAALTNNLTWKTITGSQTIVPGEGYVVNSGSEITLTLPATFGEDKSTAITGRGAGGWKLAQAASQIIHFNGVDTTTGTGGYLEFDNRYDCVEIQCIVANTEFVVTRSQGSINVT